MRRVPLLQPLSARLYRHVVIVACAAVLLTSFEDEALLAISTARASAAEAAAPQPDQSEDLSRFPDLSESRSDRGDGKVSEGAAATALGSHGIVERPSRGRVATAPTPWRVLDGASLRARLCVWQI
ncbi:MAG: hypothetical protein WBC44_05080 [Planctomycetaceae bacterium]